MKDWIVEVERKRIKPKKSETARKNSSIKNAIKYLLDENHKNHYHTKITDLNDAHIVLNNMLNQVDLRKDKRKDLGSGGNIINIASSFVLSLPADLYHPTAEEWERIHNSFLENFVSKLNVEQEKRQAKLENTDIESLSERSKKEYPLDLERSKTRFNLDEIKKLSTAVIHDDRDKPFIPGKTSGSHLNFVLCDLYNGEVVKLFTQKAGLNAVKKSFNEAIKKELKLDCKKYIPFCDRGENTPHYDDKNHHLKTLREKKVKEVVGEETIYLKQKTKPYWAARSEKIAETEKSAIEAKNKIAQVPKAKKIIKKANKSIKMKNKVIAETNKAKKAKANEIETTKNIIEKRKANEEKNKILLSQIDDNQRWLYNLTKSDLITKYVIELRSKSKDFVDFYRDVKSFVSELVKANHNYLAEVKAENPAWLKAEEKRIAEIEKNKEKQKQAQKAVRNEFTEEIELKDEYDLDAEIDKPTLTPKPNLYQRVKRGFGFN